MIGGDAGIKIFPENEMDRQYSRLVKLIFPVIAIFEIGVDRLGLFNH